MARHRADQAAEPSGTALPPPDSDLVPPNPNDDSTEECGEPSKVPSSSFPIVGVGASAGGLDAFNRLLSALPVDTGIAFVLVQHLAAAYPSALAEILSRATKMPVLEVEDEAAVEPNHVYVMPPGQSMVISQGRLQLQPRPASGQHRPVDQFFCALAEDQGYQAIGVVLSGTATDGTLGLEAIKAEGGMTFAQDNTAQQEGMPHSAIASGCVDFVLPPDEIAREIVRISRHPFTAPQSGSAVPKHDAHFDRVVELLRRATGVDFSNYKANTLRRRVTRRMIFQKMEALAEYTQLLQESSVEAEALYQDILINVTSFFRDPEAFEALNTKVFPRLVETLSSNDPLRVWTLGCSTGQEAYSVAMAFAEFAEATGSRKPLQLFATDLNATGIDKARAGVYPKEIACEISTERLRRFFVEVDGSYRIIKAIRDVCVFSRHNVLTDPPFSRIDLITCRNLLIYLDPVLQQRILPALHYALKPAGFLWLGSSETIGSYRNLFQEEDAKRKIYAKKPGSITPHFPLQPGGVPRSELTSIALRPRAEGGTDLHKEADRIVLAKFAPPGVLVSADLEILQFRGDTGAYMTPAPGKASLNLLKMLREGLLVTVRAAVLRAGQEKAPVREEGLRVISDGHREVAIEVIPIKANTKGGNEGGFLILFEEAGQAHGSQSASFEASPRRDNPGGAVDPTALQVADQDNARLAQELTATRDFLQSVIEQQESANEELQSANEEVQSSNEELQSINEELETSKEEIQSSNEELVTVNDELNNRNLELYRVNNDLLNLLGTDQLAIVMLGPDLRVRRFTPTAEKLLNLNPADVGRPLSDIKLNFDLPDLEPLLTEVFDTASDKELDVRNNLGRWYSLRLRPYKTVENRIDGVILLLLDVDLLKRAQAYTESIVATVREPLLVLDANLRVRTASVSFYQTFRVTPEETIGRLLYDLGNGHWNIPDLRRLLEDILPRDNQLCDFEMQGDFGHFGNRAMLLNARRLVQEDNENPSILLAIEDITDRKQREKSDRHHAKELIDADRHKDEFLAMLAHELRNPLAPLQHALQLIAVAPRGGREDEDLRGVMERQVQQMARLIDDLLDVSRIAHGKIELQKQRLDVTRIILNAVETSRTFIEAKSHQLIVRMAPETLWVEADEIRIAQVVSNLLNNAAKYTELGGRIELCTERNGDKATIRVTDTGVGIPNEMLAHVFDIFTQVDSSLTRSQGGLGIGLTLAKSLIEAHGGSIRAASAGLGQGSEFIIDLPLAAPGGPIEPPPKRSDQTAPPLVAHKVLIVDDATDTVFMLCKLLESLGQSVRTACDGASALEAVCLAKPDIVFSDIAMPGMNGYELVKKLRQLPGMRNVPIVALTGYAQENDRRRAQEAGFNYHLVKPTSLDAFRELLLSLQISPGSH